MQITEGQRSAAREPLRQQIRDVDAAIEAARGALQVVEQPGQAVPPVPPVPPIEPFEPVIAPDIGPFTIQQRNDEIPNLPNEYVDLAMGFFIMVAVIVVGGPIARAIARRVDRGATPPQQIPADTSAQLRRIEEAVETMALEVERVSEGQRYLTRLQAEREKLPVGRGNL